jgi:hypothetical protein
MTDDRGALEQVRAHLFGPATDDAAAPPPSAAVAHREGANPPPGVLDAAAIFRDWALRIFDRNSYCALNPTAYSDIPTGAPTP